MGYDDHDPKAKLLAELGQLLDHDFSAKARTALRARDTRRAVVRRRRGAAA